MSPGLISDEEAHAGPVQQDLSSGSAAQRALMGSPVLEQSPVGTTVTFKENDGKIIRFLWTIFYFCSERRHPQIICTGNLVNPCFRFGDFVVLYFCLKHFSLIFAQTSSLVWTQMEGCCAPPPVETAPWFFPGGPPIIVKIIVRSGKAGGFAQPIP